MQVEQQLKGLEKHLHRIFVAGAVFGALSCFARADFNLPLYAFLYLMWDQDVVRHLIKKDSHFLTPIFVGWEIQADSASSSDMGWGPPMDVLLDPSLELRRD